MKVKEKQFKSKVKGSKSNKGSKMFDDIKDGKTYNDIKWYNSNPQVLKDAASFPYANVLGLPIEISNEVANKTTLPGVMVIRYTPTVGISVNDGSDVNVVTSLLYAKNRRANSGAKTYEPADLMINYLAIGSAYAFFSELTRIYGIMNTYSRTNRYIAKGIVTALGYDYRDLLENFAQLRAYINQFAVRINSYAVPKLPYFDRQIKLASGYFKDANHDKAQVILTQCSNFYVFQPAVSETGGILVPFPLPTSGITLSAIHDAGNAILAGLEYNEDVGIMTGDTLKAYGENGVYHVSAIPTEYSVVPIYDETMLAQIHHARPIGVLTPYTSWQKPDFYKYIAIWQENGRIRYNPFVSPTNNGAAQYITSPLLDCGYTDPTPEYNAEATRLMSITQFDTESVDVTPTLTVSGTYLQTCGTEFVNTIQVYTMDENGGIIPAQIQDVSVSSSTAATDAVLLLNTLKKQMFDWAPITYVVSDPDSSSSVIHVNGEVFNYTALNYNALSTLHNACLLSLFDIGSFQQAN